MFSKLFLCFFHHKKRLLVLLSFDRCLNITKPMNRFCKPRVARFLTVLCTFSFILINCHGLFFVQLVELDGKTTSHDFDMTMNKSLVTFVRTYVCGVDLKLHPTYGKFYYEFWNVFDFCLATAIPSILLAIFNIKIMHQMRKSIEKFRINFNLKKRSNLGLYHTHDNMADQHSKMKSIYLIRIAKLKQMNFMLMTAVVTFFIFYAPYSIYYMIVYNTNTDFYGTKDNDKLIGDLLLLWSLVNVTFSFYFYCLTGNTIFRSEIKRIRRFFFRNTWTKQHQEKQV